MLGHLKERYLGYNRFSKNNYKSYIFYMSYTKNGNAKKLFSFPTQIVDTWKSVR
jgi:hypothetical protein